MSQQLATVVKKHFLIPSRTKLANATALALYKHKPLFMICVPEAEFHLVPLYPRESTYLQNSLLTDVKRCKQELKCLISVLL